MTVTLPEFAFFAMAFAAAIATPGPFAVALVARGVAFGFPSAAGMAVGGLLGDAVFAAVALFGLAVIAEYAETLLVGLRYVGAAWLIWLGVGLLRARPDSPATEASRGAGVGLGFLSGATLSLGNPKAALFYLAVFPGFFDIPRLGLSDVAMIYATIATILIGGHLIWAALAARAGRMLRTPRRVRTVNRVSGGLLTGAGVAIAAT